MDKYIWTSHAQYKMRYYRMSESLVKRVVRYPTRVEEGVIENAVACMRPAHLNSTSTRSVPVGVLTVGSQPSPPAGGFGGQAKQAKPKRYSELWGMYLLTSSTGNKKQTESNKQKQVKIITAWRYPGLSPKRNPVPANILEEAKRIISI